MILDSILRTVDILIVGDNTPGDRNILAAERIERPGDRRNHHLSEGAKLGVERIELLRKVFARLHLLSSCGARRECESCHAVDYRRSRLRFQMGLH
jgi:hypothetical protein